MVRSSAVGAQIIVFTSCNFCDGCIFVDKTDWHSQSLVVAVDSVANAVVYPPNWAILKLPAVRQKTVGRVA